MLNIVIALPRRSLGITGNFGLGLVKASNCALKFAKCVAKSAISDFLFMRLIPAKCALTTYGIHCFAGLAFGYELNPLQLLIWSS